MADERDDADDDRAATLDPSDLRVEVAAHVGPDGRLNARPSPAVRIAHVPTGLVASCDVHPTQIASHREALRVLTARVIDARAPSPS